MTRCILKYETVDGELVDLYNSNCDDDVLCLVLQEGEIAENINLFQQIRTVD